MYVKLGKDDAEFRKRIKEVFGIYKIVRDIKDKKAYDREEELKKQKVTEKLQEEFRGYITELNKRDVSAEQWRELTDRWWKEHQIV